MEEEKKLTGKSDLYSVCKSVCEEKECQLYWTRWLILAIFMVYAIAAGVQWMQYSIITNIVKEYYNVEPYEVEWTTMLHMLAYVLCILPALWMLEKAGNRITMLTAGAGICLGAWIKLFAVKPDSFSLVLIGQTIEAAAQVLTFGLAGSVTASWFGPNEIAIGGSLALFGDQLGAGLGFVLPPLFVRSSVNKDDIGEGLYSLCMFITVLSSSIFIVMLIFFKDCPDKPPSHAQIVRNEIRKKGNSLADFLKMISKKSFLLMLLCYGIHIGVFCAHATLLNRTFGFYFPGHEKDGGLIGSLIIFCGLIGSIIAGLFLDWKHMFKETSLVLYACSTICMAGYTLALKSESLVLVYVIACLMGMFMFGYYSVGLQTAIELVHPYSEGISCGLMLLAVQIMGLILTPMYRYIFEISTPLEANFSLVSLLFCGVLLSMKIPPNYRRQEAERKVKDGLSAKSFIKSVE